MTPFYPAAVFLGPNGEQFPVGYHPPPMALPYEHQQHSRQQRPSGHHQQQQQQQQRPQHTHPQQHSLQQHPVQHHQQPQHLQHIQAHQSGSFPIHGPTSAPFPFVGATVKPANSSGQSTIESISTPDMHQLQSSASLESIESSSSGSSSRDNGDLKGGETSSQENGSGNRSPLTSPATSRATPPGNQGLAQPSSSSAESQQNQTSHRPNPPLPTTPTAADTGAGGTEEPAAADSGSALTSHATASDGDTGAVGSIVETGETIAGQGQTGEDPGRERGSGQQQGQREEQNSSPTLHSKQQQQQQVTSPSSASQQQHLQSFSQYSTPYPGPHQTSPHSGAYQPPYPQPSHRSTPTSPYYPARQNPSHSKPFSGQQGQGPGVHGPMALPPGPVPGHQGYGLPPPFYGHTMTSVAPSPGSRRPIVYPGQAPAPPGSHPLSLPGVRPGQQYHPPAGYKHPYPNQGFPPDYQHPGYYATPDGWRPAPMPTLQKKPKELDKAMWVGNVLNDTTMAELQAVFEAEPTEVEGDIQHDVPESIFILSKSNCAFVNYSSHEAVDRAVRRFHDREFKNTRLVCRPRKEPGADPYSSKTASAGRYQSQHHGQASYMSDAIGYYGSDHSLMAQQMQGNDLSEAQARIEQMHSDGSPLLDNGSSSGGEGSALGGQAQQQKDNKGGPKKSQSSSPLGYAESRYFILKSLNEEDLKVSVQFGLWATQDRLVPILNDAFANTKNVYLVFSANKSGEFFGCARMMAQISVENEAVFAAKENEIWQPAIDMPLSPEMRAAMLEEIEQAAREGKNITNQEANVIARNSTTTKSWGIRFPIRWIHVHKVPFSRTTHMLNPLYENREIRVSKDGTEVDPVVGEQLLGLFKKSNRNRRGRNSVSGPGSRSNSGGSRRSSVAGESSSSLAPPQSHRSASSRRSSIMSTRSTGSVGGGDRRSSTDPSRTQGPSYKPMNSPMHVPNRGQFGGEGNQPHGGASGYRGLSRHGHYVSHSSHGSNTSQGPYAADQYPDQQRTGWNSKPNFRGGGPGGYGPASVGGSTMQGGYYQQDHIPGGHRKGGSGPGGAGGAGGKYNTSYQPSSQHGGYEYPPFHSSQAPRRHPGPQHQHYYSSYRSNIPSSSVDPSPTGYAGYKHTQGGASLGTGPSAQQGSHDQSYVDGGGSRAGPHSGGHIPPSQLGGQPIPPHPNVYAGQGPPGGYHAPFPPPGYPMIPPYMGFPYMPAPNPFMHGVMTWHPGQGPPMPGMIPGAGMLPGHHTSIPPMISGAIAEGHGMEGMVPLIGYDGVTYGYIPAEEAYHQPVFGYMPQTPHARDQTEFEADVQDDGDDKAAGKGAEEDVYEPGLETEEAESDQPSGEQQLEPPTLTDPRNHLAKESNTSAPAASGEDASREEQSAPSSTISSSSTLISGPDSGSSANAKGTEFEDGLKEKEDPKSTLAAANNDASAGKHQQQPGQDRKRNSRSRPRNDARVEAEQGNENGTD